jgi:hypothetical protein
MVMELSEYNGWQNKFTWLVHLHLSSEERLMNEIASLVADTPIGYPAGKLVEQWVREALTNWQMNVPDRYRSYDGYLRLLAWDLVSSALAYADWDILVTLLTEGMVTSDNLFTWSLYRSIMNDSHLHQPVGVLMNEAPSAYACADAIKEWFEAQMNAWIDASAVRRQHNAMISGVVYNLIQSTSMVINWDHVARAFQPGY